MTDFPSVELPDGRTIVADEAGTVAVVDSLPYCDLCKVDGESVLADFDAKTQGGPWGYLCRRHFVECGCAVGLGRGQVLVLPSSGAGEGAA